MVMNFMKWKSADDTESPSHERSTVLSEAMPRMLNTVTPTDIFRLAELLNTNKSWLEARRTTILSVFVSVSTDT